MVRYVLAGLVLLCLAGCLNSSPRLGDWPAESAPIADYDFNWRLSGDPMVAPLQVFSGAGRTWLQFAPGRTPPALFAQMPTGVQPLPYRRQDPYIIVEGIWPSMVLRGGRYVAKVQRVASAPVESAAPAPWSTPDRAAQDFTADEPGRPGHPPLASAPGPRLRNPSVDLP